MRNLLFCWSDFGSFSDAAFASNSKTGKAKDPRIQKPKIKKNPKTQNGSHLRHLVKKFGFRESWISKLLDSWGFEILTIGSVVCGFVFCLIVVLCFWYTFAVSNVFVRVAKTESDSRCTEKAEFTDYWLRFVLLLLALLPKL